MSPLLLLGAAVPLAAVAAVAGPVRRRRLERRAVAAMRRRLEASYEPRAPGAPPLPLGAPSGRVAVEPDGLYLGRGDEDDLRHVPWSAIRNVSPVPGGRLALHVARVGDVEVPGALGRRIWEGVGAAAALPVPAGGRG